MAVTIELIDSDGDHLELTDPYRLRDLGGLGMAPVQHRTERGPYQDGETYLASFLRPRIVTLGLNLAGATELAVWQYREVLNELVVALNEGFSLRATLPDGAVRQLDCRYLDGLDMAIEAKNWTRWQPAAFQAIAYNPLWYDPEAEVWSYGFSTGDGSYLFDLTYPITFGGSAVDSSEVRQYVGTWKVFPIITITGPITSPVIENETTGEILDFTGYTINTGHELVIDLRYGYKTVLLDGVTNELDELSEDSDLATWHIAPHPEATDGNNQLHVTGSASDENTMIAIQFNARYGGI